MVRIGTGSGTPAEGRAAMVTVRDARLLVRDAGSGPVLFFIHGMCGAAQVWEGQVSRLADRFRCITYDRRGHGRSSRGEAAESVATHTEDAAALIRTLGVRPIVVGSSGGARIGVELVRRHSDLVASAVLSEPPIPTLAPDLGPQLVAEIAAVVKPAVAEGGPRAGVDAFFALVCPGLWATLDEQHRDLYRDNAEMMVAELAAPPYHLDVADLAQVRTPIWVVQGDRSHPAFAAIARALAGGLPQAELRLIANSGHVTYAEQPDEFARLVAEFAMAHRE